MSYVPKKPYNVAINHNGMKIKFNMCNDMIKHLGIKDKEIFCSSPIHRAYEKAFGKKKEKK